MYVVVCSCGYSPLSTKEPIIITKISLSIDGDYCHYYTIPENTYLFASSYAKFIDTCGKFNIGDTIKFVK